MTTEHDDLAKLLQAASKAPCTISFWSDAYSRPTGYGDLFSAAILAAGYYRPRTITTAEEVDTLRRFTVIRSADGVVYERQTMWHEAGSRDLVWGAAIALPAIVLQEGWGDE
jgi:hypothetical protein